MRPEIILASSSPSRAALLRAAGFFAFSILPSGVDESVHKKRFSGAPGALALQLAQAKAQAVSRQKPDALVIAADQILGLPPSPPPAARWQLFDKPETLAQARAMLQKLRGKKHFLHNGAVLLQGGKLLWQQQSSAELVMRDFSDPFLDSYLAAEGDRLLASVGAYRLEGAGAHLFAAVRGDYFTILGLPLLPLLAALRQRGALPT